MKKLEKERDFFWVNSFMIYFYDYAYILFSGNGQTLAEGLVIYWLSTKNVCFELF